jgi:hypothetical protein
MDHSGGGSFGMYRDCLPWSENVSPHNQGTLTTVITISANTLRLDIDLLDMDLYLINGVVEVAAGVPSGGLGLRAALAVGSA